jgi:drug/metabolite transporter (DMT)-like permease
VAVLLGYFAADEALGLRTILGTLAVLISVIVITTMRTKTPIVTPSPEDTG